MATDYCGMEILDISDSNTITRVSWCNPWNCAVISSYGSRSNNLGTWGLDMKGDKIYVTYITTVIPFSGTWSGIKCIELNK